MAELTETGSVHSVEKGLSTDTLVPADYDGDNRTDFAVFRNGNWFIRRSSDNQFQAVQFGLTGDKPIPNAYLPN